MIRKVSVLLLIILTGIGCRAQEIVRGMVYDTDSIPAPDIIVRLYDKGKLKAFTNCNKDGKFSLKLPPLDSIPTLRFLSQHHETLDYSLENPGQPVRIYLHRKAFELQEVTVKAPERRIKGDTIVYDVAALTKKGDRTIEDIIKKIPGVDVSGDGEISYDGRPINRFYIEGLDLMGKRYAVATQSINPADISSVSVYERHQPTKVLKGEVESEKAALNLKLKKGRMLKPVGYVKGGAGTGDETLWNGEVYGMLIAPKFQAIISAKGNNEGEIYGPRKTGDRISVFSFSPFGEPPLARSRFTGNHSYFATANALFKLNDDLTVKVNSSCSLNHERIDGGSVTEYLDPDNQNIIYREEVASRPDYQNVAVSANILNNGDRLYFSDDIEFSAGFAHNRYGITADNRHVQTLDADNYMISNKLKTIVKSGNKTYEIHSEIDLRRNPGSVMSAEDAATGKMTVWQNVKTRDFHTREHTSLLWRTSRLFAFGSEISFEAYDNRFMSDAVVGGETASGNDLSGYRIITSAEPFIKLSKWGVSWKTTVPVRLYNMKYSNLIDMEASRFNRVIADLSTSFHWTLNQMTHINLSLERKNNIGDLRDFIDNPIYTTFRNSRTLGTGRLRRGHDNILSASYSYRNFMHNIFINSFLTLKRSVKNTISVQNVSNSGTSSSLGDMTSKGRMISLLIDVNKKVRSIETTFFFTAQGVWQRSESMRSGVTVTVDNDFYTVSAKSKTYMFNDILAFSANAGYSFQRQSFNGLMPSNTTNMFSLVGKTGIYPMKNIEIYASANYSRMKLGENNYKGNIFVDAGAAYILGRWELDFSAHNLTNMRRYDYTIFNSLDVTSSSYTLRPIEFILSAKFRF